MSNPVEEYLLEKEAQGGLMSRAWGGLKRGLKTPVGTALAGGVLGTVGTFGVAAGARGLDNAILAITRKRDFNKMLDHNPDLAQSFQENPKQFNAQFTSLRTMNPDFSQDPIVAGTVMRQMVASPATAGTAVMNAASQRKALPPRVLEAQPRFGPVTIPTAREGEMEQLRLQEMRDRPGIQAARDTMDEIRLEQQGQMHGAKMEEMARRQQEAQATSSHAQARHHREAELHPWKKEELQERVYRMRHGRDD